MRRMQKRKPRKTRKNLTRRRARLRRLRKRKHDYKKSSRKSLKQPERPNARDKRLRQQSKRQRRKPRRRKRRRKQPRRKMQILRILQQRKRRPMIAQRTALLKLMTTRRLIKTKLQTKTTAIPKPKMIQQKILIKTLGRLNLQITIQLMTKRKRNSPLRKRN